MTETGDEASLTQGAELVQLTVDAFVYKPPVVDGRSPTINETMDKLR